MRGPHFFYNLIWAYKRIAPIFLCNLITLQTFSPLILQSNSPAILQPVPESYNPTHNPIIRPIRLCACFMASILENLVEIYGYGNEGLLKR